MPAELCLWGFFSLSLLVMLVYDIFFYQKKHSSMSFKQATQWSIAWVIIAVVFGLVLWFVRDTENFIVYLTAYVVEKSLSLDNIFVFVMLFEQFKLSLAQQRRVLSWGVMGAIVMRIIMIILGVALINKFHWVIYIFGGFLIYTAFKFWQNEEIEKNPYESIIYKTMTKYLPITTENSNKFWIRKTLKDRKIWMATPLLVVLIMVEFTDLIFAIDSIPAVLAISSDMLIVVTSNIFAVMGLRAMYFMMANAIKSFHYLSKGLAALLMFVGSKMLLVDIIKLPILVSLSAILAILTVSVMASLIKESRAKQT
jgi:tellurite resistance protein TerC